jgi:hypothetical protein
VLFRKLLFFFVTILSLKQHMGGVHGLMIDVYQAEDASLFSGVQMTAEHVGYSGTGYADFEARGTFATFDVQTTLLGDYKITLRYANGGVKNRSMEIHIDGTKQDSGFELQPTGAWSTWKQESITMYLSSGNHELMIVASEEQGPNIDWMSLEGPLFSPSTVLDPDQALSKGEFRFSPGGLFMAGLDGTGSLVIQDGSSSTIIWSSGNIGGELAYMQGDGNLVVRDGTFTIFDSHFMLFYLIGETF